MKIKKLCALTICLLLGMSIVACNKKEVGTGDDSPKDKTSVSTENDSNSIEEDGREVVKLKSYNDLADLYNKKGSAVEKVLSQNNIDYHISDNKSFIASTSNTYTKFEKEYNQLLYAGTSTSFESGEGASFIEIVKDLHKDIKPSLEDPYINTIADFYVAHVPNSNKEDFIKELSEAFDKAIETQDVSQIDYNDNAVYVNVAAELEDSTVKIVASFSEIFTMPEREVFTKEYNTVKEFDNVYDSLIDNSKVEEGSRYEQVQVNESDNFNKTQYTIKYKRNSSDSFEETIGFDFGGFATKDTYDEDEYTQFSFDDSAKGDFDKLVDVLSKLVGFDVNSYISSEQLMDEIESRMMSNLLGYEDILGISLPIPGAYIDYLHLSSFDENDYAYIYAKPEQLDIHKNLYDSSLASPYLGRGYYEVNIEINRPVIAEGITSK